MPRTAQKHVIWMQKGFFMKKLNPARYFPHELVCFQEISEGGVTNKFQTLYIVSA